ncbi:hypothetical protein L810_4243 [Burkholderia sp. AU4i]|nr:hypothetical protein L810_4243 [Burkholderia sp. AU4i]
MGVGVGACRASGSEPFKRRVKARGVRRTPDRRRAVTA